MNEEISQITKNSLFAMVDLFLDFVKGEDVDSQRDNIAEFIIDCHNITHEDPEFNLIQAKFEEEFENSIYYMEQSKKQITESIQSAIANLITGGDTPPLIADAIHVSY